MIVSLVALFYTCDSAMTQPLNIKFGRIGIEDGLSNATVTAIIQDHEGFLWFGTEDGLNKYDGYTFTVFQHKPSDTTSLSNSYINALCIDSSGNLWVGTNNGLNRYVRGTNSFVHLHKRIEGFGSGQSFPVNDVKTDSNGMVWIATIGRGLYAYNPFTDLADHVTKRLVLSDTNGNDHIGKLIIDGKDRIWFTSPVGIGCISSDRKTLTRYERVAEGKKMSAIHVSLLAKDGNGKPLIGTLHGDIYTFDDARQEFFKQPVPDREPFGGIMSLRNDSHRQIWIGSFNQGLFLVDSAFNLKTRFIHNSNDPTSVASNRVYQIFEDRSGSVWMGTWKGGISVYHPYASKFQLYTHALYDPFSLSDATVWSICEDRNNVLWVATEQGGINRFDKKSGRFRHYKNDPKNTHSVSSNYVIALSVDSSGALWAATAYEGLNKYDPENDRFIRYVHNPSDPSSLKTGNVNTLYTDRDGDTWVGGNFLSRFDRRLQRFFHYDSLQSTSNLVEEIPFKNTEIMSLAEDSAGQLWITMFPHGLLKLDKQKNIVRNYSYPSGMYYVHTDREGTVWLGTFGLGLVRYVASADSFENFTELDGLPSNFIKSILSDAQGNLWLGTSKGLSRFNPDTRTARNYGPDDGIQGYEFRTGSCFMSRDGKMYFGGVNGFNAFYPDQLVDNPFIPTVVITQIHVSGKPYQPDGGSEVPEIELSYDQNAVEFEFVCLNYTSPQKNNYAYMLEGFDTKWVHSGNRRYVSYAHLDPGSYIFRVKASNNDGVWNETGASVRFVIAPPFWATWWFISLIVLVSGASAYGLYRYRINKLLEVERTRSAIATDLHDDIGTSLTNIALFSDLAQRDIDSGSADPTRHLQKIASTSRSLLDSMNDIVWSIKPENDALEQIILRMEDYAVEMLEENGIDLHVHIPDSLKTLKLPMTVRRNLFLIFKEAVSNVLKHSQSTRVEVIIAKKETDTRKPDIQILIKDNGKGFTHPAHRPGNGLNNMELRARLLGGTVTVQSAPAKGTEIEIRFPVKSPI